MNFYKFQMITEFKSGEVVVDDYNIDSYESEAVIEEEQERLASHYQQFAEGVVSCSVQLI